jgi:hypothetical protein
VNIRRRSTSISEADPLVRKFVEGLVGAGQAMREYDEQLMIDSYIKLVSAARDIASRGELREVEAQFAELLGEVHVRNGKRGSKRGRR